MQLWEQTPNIETFPQKIWKNKLYPYGKKLLILKLHKLLIPLYTSAHWEYISINHYSDIWVGCYHRAITFFHNLSYESQAVSYGGYVR